MKRIKQTQRRMNWKWNEYQNHETTYSFGLAWSTSVAVEPLATGWPRDQNARASDSSVGASSPTPRPSCATGSLKCP